MSFGLKFFGNFIAVFLKSSSSDAKFLEKIIK
jgi:hypothetical protein